MPELDLYHCMTWGLAEANLRQQTPPGEIEQYVIGTAGVRWSSR